MKKVINVIVLCCSILPFLINAQESKWKIFFAGENIYDFTWDSMDLWAVTSTGIYRYDKSMDLSEEIEIPLNYNTYSNRIRVDNGHRLWLFSSGSGLYCLEDNNWNKYDNEINSPTGLYEIDSENRLWLSGCSSLWMLEQGRWLKYDYDFSSTSYFFSYDMIIDGDQNIWLIGKEELMSFAYKLVKLNGTEWIDFSNTERLLGPTIKCDAYGNIWSLCKNGNDGWKLRKFNGQEFIDIALLPDELQSDERTVFNIDLKNNFWIANTNGFIKYDGDEWEYFNLSDVLGIESFEINSVKIDNYNNKWISTNSGLVVFNEEGIILPTKDLDISENIHIYPNPANDVVYIFTSMDMPVESINIYSMSGQLLRTAFTKNEENSISMNDLADGVYLMDIRTKEGRALKKVVKM